MLRAAALIGAAWTVPSSSWEEDMHSPRIYRGKDADMLASRVVVLMTSIPPRLPSIEAVVPSSFAFAAVELHSESTTFCEPADCRRDELTLKKQ